MSSEDANHSSSPPERKEEEKPPAAAATTATAAGGGGGWGGWGFSLSVLSDLQKAASTAAEEISTKAVAVAKSAAKGIADLDAPASPGSAVVGEEDKGEKLLHSTPAGAGDSDSSSSEGEEDQLRRSALEKLENAGEDSLFGQGLKVLDNSVETFASGAWQALGNALKGGSTLVHKLEHSAANLADSLQQSNAAGTLAPSILETGKSFTAKGMQVLERVGKETMELLITEGGFEVEKGSKDADEHAEFEEVTFERCFYIYGGPDQLEELEALSSHYALLFNRKKAKLLSEQKSFYDGQLKQVQQIFRLDADTEEVRVDSDKGKSIEAANNSTDIEMKNLCDSSVSKAADMAAGFAAALAGLAANEVIQRTTDRLETVHSEGVHRISELCCFAVSQLFLLGKSVISNANKSKADDTEEDDVKIEWPEDSVSKAKIIRCKAQSMCGYVEAVSHSFSTGTSDIMEAYLAAIQSVSSNKHDDLPQQNSVQDKADTISKHLSADRTSALAKIQDALHYLAYVVLSSSMPTA